MRETSYLHFSLDAGGEIMGHGQTQELYIGNHFFLPKTVLSF